VLGANGIASVPAVVIAPHSDDAPTSLSSFEPLHLKNSAFHLVYKRFGKATTDHDFRGWAIAWSTRSEYFPRNPLLDECVAASFDHLLCNPVYGKG